MIIEKKTIEIFNKKKSEKKRNSVLKRILTLNGIILINVIRILK